MSLRLERLSRRNLADVSVIGLVGAGKTNPAGKSTGARPRLERNFADVLEKKSLDQRNPFVVDPTPVGTSVLADRFCGYLRFFHSLLQRSTVESFASSACTSKKRGLQSPICT